MDATKYFKFWEGEEEKTKKREKNMKVKNVSQLSVKILLPKLAAVTRFRVLSENKIQRIPSRSFRGLNYLEWL